MHALPGVDNGTIGIQQRFRGRFNRRALGTVAKNRRGRRLKGVGNVFGEEIGRELDQRWTGSAIAHLGESAAHGFRDCFRHRDLFAVFGHMAEVEGGTEVGLDLIDEPRIAHGQDNNGSGIAKGLRHAAEGIFGAGTALHAEDADLFARSDAAQGIRHVQPDAFLADDDGADVELRRRFDERVDRIGEEDVDAFGFQDFGYCVGDFHGLPFASWRPSDHYGNRIVSVYANLADASQESPCSTPPP